MKIEKLPSGSYRIRQMYNNKRYCITLDHKPTMKEATILMADRMNADVKPQKADTGTLNDFVDKYIASREKNGCSPSTIRSYESRKRCIPDWFAEMNLFDITEKDFQKAVNEYSEEHSPKATLNLYTLMKCVIAEYRPVFVFSIKLPSKDKKKEYEPSTKDIKAILKESEGTRYSLPLKLASIGLRVGEALCLTKKDISDDNVLTISKDIVLDKNNHYIIKNTPKTNASFRRILVPSDIADMIRKRDSIFEGNPLTINRYLTKTQDKLGIPRFKLHTMRHFASAYLLKKKNFSVPAIEDYMGWEHGSNTMQKVYAYNLDPEDSQKDIADAFSDL